MLNIMYFISLYSYTLFGNMLYNLWSLYLMIKILVPSLGNHT